MSANNSYRSKETKAIKSFKDQLLGKMSREELVIRCSELIKLSNEQEVDHAQELSSYKKKLEEKTKLLDAVMKEQNKKIGMEPETHFGKKIGFNEKMVNDLINSKEKLNKHNKEMYDENKYLQKRIKDMFGRAILAEIVCHESNPRPYTAEDYDRIRRGDKVPVAWVKKRLFGGFVCIDQPHGKALSGKWFIIERHQIMLMIKASESVGLPIKFKYPESWFTSERI